jgi:hypothetical protein
VGTVVDTDVRKRVNALLSADTDSLTGHDIASRYRGPRKSPCSCSAIPASRLPTSTSRSPPFKPNDWIDFLSPRAPPLKTETLQHPHVFTCDLKYVSNCRILRRG